MTWYYLFRLNPHYPDNATNVYKTGSLIDFQEEEHKCLTNRLGTDEYFFHSIWQEENDDDMAKEKAIQHLKDVISRKKANQERFSKK